MSNKQPLVTVLIAAYNAQEFISQAVDSVISQSYDNIEIIICNDCSTDKTLEILNQIASIHNNVTILNNDSNLGYLKTFNRLLASANGDYISFLDADDYLAPDKIIRQVELLENNPTIGVVGCQYASVSSSGEVISASHYPLIHCEIVQRMEAEMSFCGSSVMISKAVLMSIGGYREFFIGCVAEDYDWLWRILDKFKSANLDYIGYYYRFHTNSLTRKVNFSIKKRHIHDIVKYLATERKIIGSDFIERGDDDTYNQVIYKIGQPYIVDKGLLYRKVIIEYAINKDYHNAWMYYWRLCKITAGFNLKTFIVMSLLLLLNYSILIKIKKLSGISHLSSRI